MVELAKVPQNVKDAEQSLPPNVPWIVKCDPNRFPTWLGKIDLRMWMKPPQSLFDLNGSAIQIKRGLASENSRNEKRIKNLLNMMVKYRNHVFTHNHIFAHSHTRNL